MGDRLKALRKALNMTQQEFADRLNIKRNTLANYETGRNEPIDAVYSLICREFNVNEHWLRTGEGEMFRKLDRMDELMEAAGRFFANETDEFRLRFVSAAFNYTDAQWKALESYAKLLLGEDSE